MEELCMVCRKKVTVQIFQGTDLCSDICRKKFHGELPLEEGDNHDLPTRTDAPVRLAHEKRNF